MLGSVRKKVGRVKDRSGMNRVVPRGQEKTKPTLWKAQVLCSLHNKNQTKGEGGLEEYVFLKKKKK